MEFRKLIEDDCNVLQKIISSFIIMVVVSQISAHEFWLEPINFSIKANEKIQAHEKVGQDFKGNTYAYLESSYESLNLTLGDNTHAIKSRLGDLPAVNQLVEVEGLAILSAVTTPSEITYETWEKFSNFIKNKGLDWVFEAHKKRNLPEKNFVETYRRYAKSLVKVGHGKGNDKALGLIFEWVLETNPYTSTEGTIKAQLLWQGKPHANAHVSIFNRVDGQLIKSELVTNDLGKVDIPKSMGGKFLINAVHMIEAPAKMAAEKDAVWESRWASITYELIPRH
jgi:uncharacterized GH25 family protein